MANKHTHDDTVDEGWQYDDTLNRLWRETDEICVCCGAPVREVISDAYTSEASGSMQCECR